jgi:hypothetical protein
MRCAGRRYSLLTDTLRFRTRLRLSFLNSLLTCTGTRHVVELSARRGSSLTPSFRTLHMSHDTGLEGGKGWQARPRRTRSGGVHTRGCNVCNKRAGGAFSGGRYLDAEFAMAD